MPQAIYGIALYFGASAGAAATIATVTTVAAVAGSVVYQQKMKKKAAAAAQKLRRQQEAQAAALQAQLKKAMNAGKFEGGTFQSASGPRDITEMIRSTTASRRVVYGRARLGGIWIYAETTGASNETLHLIMALTEGPVSEIETVYFDDEAVTLDADGNGTGKWAGLVTIKKHLGTPNDPAEPLLTGASLKWTADHKLTGIAYLYVKINVNVDLYSSIPDISAVVKGKADILDPRTNTRGFSDNPALCLADYMATPIVGPGIPFSKINQAALIHAADVCDEEVETLLGKEKRYRCQGAIDLSSTVEDNMLLFAQAMNGDVIHQGGKFWIQAGEYVAPTFTIDLDMLSGPIEFTNLQPRKQRSNLVKGTYLAEENKWQKFDFPSVSDPDAISQDGQEVVSDLTLELVGSGSQAQRLAGMELRQARRGRSFSLTCNLKAMPAKCGQNVRLELGRYADGDVFRVVQWKLSIGNDGMPQIKLTLLESHPEIYEWDVRREKLINVPVELNAKSPQVAIPVMSPTGTSEPGLPASVTITSLTPGAVIRYSLTDPVMTDADGTLYTAPVTVNDGDFLWARAFKDKLLASPLAVEIYVA